MALAGGDYGAGMAGEILKSVKNGPKGVRSGMTEEGTENVICKREDSSGSRQADDSALISLCSIFQERPAKGSCCVGPPPGPICSDVRPCFSITGQAFEKSSMLT